VWGEPVRPLVQQYLYEIKLKRIEAAAELDVTNDAARVTVYEANRTGAKLRATAALIIAAGAMLAAMPSAFIAFLALGHWYTPWGWK
jgi:hypothetical protein